MENLKQNDKLFHIYQNGEVVNEEAIKENLKFFAILAKKDTFFEKEFELKRAYPTFTQIKYIHKFIYFMFKRKCLINFIELWKNEDGDVIVDFCVNKCKILEKLFSEVSQEFDNKLKQDLEMNK